MTAEHGLKCWPLEHGAAAHGAGGEEQVREGAVLLCPRSAYPLPSRTLQDQTGITHRGLHFSLEGASKDNGLCFPPPSPDLPSSLTLRPGPSQLPPCSAPRPLSDPADLALISLPPTPAECEATWDSSLRPCRAIRSLGRPPTVGGNGTSHPLPDMDTPWPVPPRGPRPLLLTPNSSCPSLIGPPAPGHIYRNATQQNNPNRTNVPGKAASFQISGA